MLSVEATSRTKEDISPAFVIALLHDRGLSLRSLAAQHGYAPTTFSTALRVSYPAVEKIIASALDSTPEKLWPIRAARRASRNERQRGELRR